MILEDRVSIRQLAEELKLNIVHMPKDKEYYVYTQDINRPGLQFAGYFEHFAFDRIQIVGISEYNFFSNINDQVRRDVLDKLGAETKLMSDVPVTVNLTIKRGTEELEISVVFLL